MTRDGDQWMDDSVEIFMDTRLDKKTYYQIIVNAAGAVQDLDKGPGRMEGVWNADIEVAVKKIRGEYHVEAAVTLASLGNPSVQSGAKWGLEPLPQPQTGSRRDLLLDLCGPLVPQPGRVRHAGV